MADRQTAGLTLVAECGRGTVAGRVNRNLINGSVGSQSMEG